jgi:hydrogenase maturation protease
MKILVMGIGQSLRGDDGIGPEAVRRWSQDHPQPSSETPIETVYLETPGLELLTFLEDADAAVLVDAVSSGGSPGTIRVVTSLSEPSLSPGEKTAHGFGVAETISLARTSGIRLPEPLILIGIEASGFALGSGLSEPVRRAIPQAAEEIQRVVQTFRNAESTP